MLFFYMSLIDEEIDRNSFEEIYYTYRKQMLYLAKSLLNNDSEAEDVIHDVFTCIATRHMPLIRSIENPIDLRNYLLKATKNTALNVLKKKKRSILSFDNMEGMERQCSELSDDSFVEWICKKAEYDRVVEGMKMLKEPYRDVLYYHFVLEMSVPETAKSLKRSVDTTKKQLLRGKKKLLELLKDGGEK